MMERELFGIDKLNVVRSKIPAVTHVDYSARIQTVHADTNARFHSLLTRFKDITGVSRKYAIPLLEYLDREHVTSRTGDERLIL